MAKINPSAQINPRHPVLVNAAKLITQRLDEMLAYESCLENPDNVYKLHEMRIAGKRLRYTMEVFQPVYVRYTDAGAEFGAMLQSVKDLQEHLGILHDADVLVPQILEHLGRVVKDGYGLPASVPQHTSDKGKGSPKTAKGAEQKASAAKSKNALPIVGVHQVDYAACEGLLTLCSQLRADRDAQYAKLIQEWQQIRAEQVFERLRDLLDREKGTEGRKGEKEKRRKGEEKKGEAFSLISHPSSLLPSISEDPDAANRQTPQIQRAPGEPGHVAAARRRVPPRAPEKGGESEPQGGKTRQRRDASAPARPAKPTPPVARNGAARNSRHTGTGTDSDSGAGKGGTE